MNVSTKIKVFFFKKLKHAFKFKQLSVAFLAVFVLLSSCSKNMADMPVQENTEVNQLKQSSPSQMNNSLVEVPFGETLFVPCANGGAGEDVALSGTTHLVYQMNWNDHGFSLVYHSNSRGITGVGVSSGEIFRGSAGTQGSVRGSWVNNQWKGITIERMRIIGNNTSYVVNYKYQLIVTADGKVTVNTSEKSIDCSR